MSEQTVLVRHHLEPAGPSVLLARARAIRRRLREVEHDPALLPLSVAMKRRACELEMEARLLALIEGEDDPTTT